jgi:hypothetical protein
MIRTNQAINIIFTIVSVIILISNFIIALIGFGFITEAVLNEKNIENYLIYQKFFMLISIINIWIFIGGVIIYYIRYLIFDKPRCCRQRQHIENIIYMQDAAQQA